MIFDSFEVSEPALGWKATSAIRLWKDPKTWASRMDMGAISAITHQRGVNLSAVVIRGVAMHQFDLWLCGCLARWLCGKAARFGGPCRRKKFRYISAFALNDNRKNTTRPSLIIRKSFDIVLQLFLPSETPIASNCCQVYCLSCPRWCPIHRLSRPQSDSDVDTTAGASCD